MRLHEIHLLSWRRPAGARRWGNVLRKRDTVGNNSTIDTLLLGIGFAGTHATATTPDERTMWVSLDDRSQLSQNVAVAQIPPFDALREGCGAVDKKRTFVLVLQTIRFCYTSVKFNERWTAWRSTSPQADGSPQGRPKCALKVCAQSAHPKGAPQVRTHSVRSKCAPKVRNQSLYPKCAPKVRAQSAHPKCAPKVCVQSVHPKCAPEVNA